MLNTRRGRPSTYSSNFLIIHKHSATFNHITKVFDLPLREHALFSFRKQAILSQSLKHCPEMFHMLTSGLTVYQNVIQVHSDILVQHVGKHIVH